MPIDLMTLERIRSNDSTLTSLNIRYHFSEVGQVGVATIADALKFNITLTSLDLIGFETGAPGAKAIAAALKVNTTLTSIKLTENEIGSVGAAAIADALKFNNTLTSLDLGFSRVGAQGGKALAEALKVNNSLVSLSLIHNYIGAQGVKALAKALKVNRCLRSLDLRQCELGDRGATTLAEVLKVNTTLTNLDLTSNKIGAEGAKALAESLKVNTTLTNLDFWNNKIGVVGAEVLADALKANTFLTNLDLTGDEIGSAGAMALAEVLKVNTTLTNLDLTSNKIGAEGAKALADALKDNITLTNIDLSDNKIYSELLEISFYTSHRNMNISFLLKDGIKAAWSKPIASYSLEDYQSALLKMNSIFRNVNHVNVSELYEKLIESIFELRLSDDKSEIELTEAVFEKLMGYISSLSLNLETLPDTSYPSEFARLLSARVNVKNVGDAEAQSMALASLVIPFHDVDLREDAKAELIGLLNNSYFSNLSEGSKQRRALDLLTLDLSCQHPYERDLMGFALASYSRLSGGGKITFDQVMNKLNENEAVQADFEKLLTEECESNGWSREVLREKCLEVLTQEFSPAPPRSTSPNPHGLFQPFVVSTSPVAEVKSTQKKAT